jgi:hypothetical protein
MPTVARSAFQPDAKGSSSAGSLRNRYRGSQWAAFDGGDAGLTERAGTGHRPTRGCPAAPSWHRSAHGSLASLTTVQIIRGQIT